MIFALEGPDKSGKSTLFEACKHALESSVRFVQGLATPAALLPYMAQICAGQARLWEQLYEPKRVYFCDRNLFLTSLVYDELHGRETTLNIARWIPEVRILYLEVPLEELQKRHTESPDALLLASQLPKLVSLYEKHLRKFMCYRLDGTLLRHQLVSLVASIVNMPSWR